MSKEALKDSFERVLHAGDGNLPWDSDDFPFDDEREMFYDPYFQLEMELFIEKKRLSIATAHTREALRRLQDRLDATAARTNSEESEIAPLSGTGRASTPNAT